jgi:glucoamylase
MGILSAKLIARLAVLAACSVANANRPNAANDIDAFIEKQRAISLQGALDNIGPNGSRVEGAAAGVIVASPTKDDPNCEPNCQMLLT